MKLVVYRPFHEIWFKNPVARILRREIIPSKYEPLFDFLAQTNEQLYISTSLHFRPGFRGWMDLVRESVRLVMWAIVNRIDMRRVGFVFTRAQLERMDAILFMHYGSFAHEQDQPMGVCRERAVQFSGLRLSKIVHMTHYAYRPTAGAENLKILKPDLLVAENDLSKYSSFFHAYFGDLKCDFYHMPFVAGARFQRLRVFAERINKLGVTGSITYKMRDPEFVTFFGQSELQPMRRIIYSQRDALAEHVDCFIYDLNELREVGQDGANAKTPETRRAQAAAMARQRNYYDADIVKFFNRYRMFAVPEEVCGLPGIGFVEGMACGSAYFGLDDPMYRDIGMVPGIHYVAYDGSMEGLLDKISFYQKHTVELEAIAEKGYRFVCERLAPDQVYGAFLERVRSTVHDI